MAAAAWGPVDGESYETPNSHLANIRLTELPGHLYPDGTLWERPSCTGHDELVPLAHMAIPRHIVSISGN
ncbi:hypothetical protein ACFL5Z_13230 [Planctomycetota bacterium]